MKAKAGAFVRTWRAGRGAAGARRAMLSRRPPPVGRSTSRGSGCPSGGGMFRDAGDSQFAPPHAKGRVALRNKAGPQKALPACRVKPQLALGEDHAYAIGWAWPGT